MGRGGIAFAPKPDDICEVIKETRGIISDISDHYKVWPSTIYRYLDSHPDAKEVLNGVRELHLERSLDNAEKTVRKCVSKIENPIGDHKLAFQAAMYLLNNKGKPRGYAHPEASSFDKEKIVSMTQMFDASRASFEAEIQLKGLDQSASQSSPS